MSSGRLSFASRNVLVRGLYGMGLLRGLRVGT
jgi:hypothetical protein